MGRLGQKLIGQIKKETRRYNTVVNRYNRQNPQLKPVARITNAELLNSGMKADEIRLQLKLMSLLQSEKDFVRPTSTQPNAYEQAQFDYLRKRQKAALTREFNRIQKEVMEKVKRGEIINTNMEQLSIKAEISNLTKQPRTGPSLLRQLERVKRRQLNKIRYGSYEAPDWVEVTLEHFLAGMSKASLDNTEAGRIAIKLLEQLNNRQFQDFLRDSPNIKLELVYDTDISVSDRANEIMSALEKFLLNRDDIKLSWSEEDDEDDFWVN